MRKEINPWLFASIRQEKSGLKNIIWVQSKSQTDKSGPRILVQQCHSKNLNIEQTVIVTIGKIPRQISDKSLCLLEFELVSNFVITNRKALLSFWNNRIDTVDFFVLIKKVD